MSNNSFFGIFSFLRVGRKVSWTLRQNKIITFLFFLKYVKSVCKCLPPSINNHEKLVSVTKYVFYWITITKTYTGFPDRKDLHRISRSPRLTQDFRITKTYTGFPDRQDLHRISGSQTLAQDFLHMCFLSEIGHIYCHTLQYVFTCIDLNEESGDEIKRILNQEMTDASCICFAGRTFP